MLYDGDCRFCTLWIRRWQQCTGDAVDYLPLQDGGVPGQYPELARESLEQAVHFINVDGTVSSGAEAVFRALATQPSLRWPLWLYLRFRFIARPCEFSYMFVATHRTMFSRLTRLLWGGRLERPEFQLVRWSFLRALAVIYFIAFVSLWVQVPGLIGEEGILPAADLMSQAHAAVEANGVGIDRFRLLPTWCWFGVSDGFLQFQCAAGATLAVLLMAGTAPPICLALMWTLYLSLTSVGREFLGFQWDNLLLEAGLLAILFAPLQLLPRPSRERPPSRMVVWLFRLLLFKLMFLSGVVKLASGDEAWRDLTALTFHYETQPLPNWIAWHVHQLPVWVHKGSCAIMFAIELGAPFLIFAPRRPRMLGGLALALLQLLIIVTGNYTFFNWLTLALCLMLLDDFALARLLPKKLTALYSAPARRSGGVGWRWKRWRTVTIAPLVVLIASVSTIQLWSALGPLPHWTEPVTGVYRWISPLRSVNSYGLFAVMTRERPEIIVEGSNDGQEWKPYEFRYKAGDVNRRPGFVAPHQPRLDWQLWFAALGDVRQNVWFVNFCIRLLQGSPEVLDLLESNPFPDQPPRYIRAQLYDYRFTTYAEKAQTGAWWTREFKHEYLRPISLDMLQPPAGTPTEPPTP